MIGGLTARPRPTRPVRIRLFDPNQMLAVIGVLFWPLRYFPIVLVPAVCLAALTAFKHRNDISIDLGRLLGEFSFVVHLLLSLLIINLSARLSMGAVIRASGGAVRDFGLGFFLGFIPRFYVDRSSIVRLDREGQLWAFGAPLLARLSYFAFGTLAWATFRSGGTWFASLALLVSQVGLWAFLFAMMPLLPGDGYNWLATYFRQPLLRQRAFTVLSAKLRRRPLPPRFQSSEVALLMAFAVCSILVLAGVAVALLIIWGTLLIRNLQGIGALIFIVILAGFAMWLLRFATRVGRRDREAREARLLRAAMFAQAHAVTFESPSVAQKRLKWRLSVLAGAALMLVIVMFLPSSYDPAGPFRILPVERSEAVAGTEGQVVNVTVREGDWVNAGQVLAHLSSTVQQRDVALTREDLEDAQARLAQLAGNDVRHDAAQEEVDRLRLQLDHDEAQLERTAIRAPRAGFVTTPNPELLTGVWLKAGDGFLQIDNTKVVEAEIDIPQSDIAFVRTGAEVRLRPWSDGNREIVGHVDAIAGSADGANDSASHDRRSFGNGAPSWHAATNEQPPIPTMFGRSAGYGSRGAGLSVADRQTGPVSARSERKSRGTFPDKIDNGEVVRVKVSVPNAETGLRSAMTGYAKISGPKMTVGEAYLRFSIRLFTIELWSWVP